MGLFMSTAWANFNPRSPCGERLKELEETGYLRRFQSTLPVWGATVGQGLNFQSVGISIHAPRVGSDPNAESPGGNQPISIHAPRVGSDEGREALQGLVGISIHAPRVGSDKTMKKTDVLTINFNPRSPCGERR